jgi:DNA-binding CsgD family transcriptional regulator
MRLRTLLYVVSAPLTGALGVNLLFAGWLSAGLLVVTPLVVPVLVAFGFAVRQLGDAERALASRLLGLGVVARRGPGRRGFFSRRRARDPLGHLTPREREVLELMAEGRSNAAIASTLVLTLGAVEKHIANIFQKLRLPPSGSDHRRVLAVLAYLQER